MKNVIIFLDFEDGTKIHKLHEFEVTNEDWKQMLSDNIKGFYIVNPKYQNIKTRPNVIVKDNVLGYFLGIKKLLNVDISNDVMLICKYEAKQPVSTRG